MAGTAILIITDVENTTVSVHSKALPASAGKPLCLTLHLFPLLVAIKLCLQSADVMIPVHMATYLSRIPQQPVPHLPREIAAFLASLTSTSNTTRLC